MGKVSVRRQGAGTSVVRGIVFDKDGTLFDFNATWGAWTLGMLSDEAGEDAALLADMAQVLGYDMENRRFLSGSIVIAETVDVIAGRLLTLLPGTDRAVLTARMKAKSLDVPQVEAVPLRAFTAGLLDRGLHLGVATNDAEGPARRHLTTAGILDDFAFVAGYDSGHGAKPGPGQLLAFCAATGLDPADCVMVGDSTHDLDAGRAAGMACVGVLTGPAPHAELAPHADIVLPSIAGLPAWLDSHA
jgi:phosphoglycolate phosphatase